MNDLRSIKVKLKYIYKTTNYETLQQNVFTILLYCKLHQEIT